MYLNLEKRLYYEARLAWEELGRMCHGSHPPSAVTEALHLLVQVHIMNYREGNTSCSTPNHLMVQGTTEMGDQAAQQSPSHWVVS